MTPVNPRAWDRFRLPIGERRTRVGVPSDHFVKAEQPLTHKQALRRVRREIARRKVMSHDHR